VQVGPQDGDRDHDPHPLGMRSATCHQPRRQREAAHPEELRSKREPPHQHDAAGQREPCRAFGGGTGGTTGEEHEREDDGPKERAEYDQTEPPAEPEGRRQDDLSQPLLVEPGLAVRHGREDVRPKDRVRVEHDVAGAQVVRQVVHGERRPRDHDDRDRDSARRPDMREPDLARTEAGSRGAPVGAWAIADVGPAIRGRHRQTMGVTEAATPVLRRTSYAEPVEAGIPSP
jgi:hypothetical protein